MCVLKFSSFNKGANKGGLIIEQKPYENILLVKCRTYYWLRRKDENGNPLRVGIEGAFGKYLNGKDGKILNKKNRTRPMETNSRSKQN
jgi:cell division protein FtsI (penicillin-binding protein 3)